VQPFKLISNGERFILDSGRGLYVAEQALLTDVRFDTRSNVTKSAAYTQVTLVFECFNMRLEKDRTVDIDEVLFKNEKMNKMIDTVLHVQRRLDLFEE